MGKAVCLVVLRERPTMQKLRQGFAFYKAAVKNFRQWTQVWPSDLQWVIEGFFGCKALSFKMIVTVLKEEGPSNTSASRSGNTGGPSAGHFYLV